MNAERLASVVGIVGALLCVVAVTVPAVAVPEGAGPMAAYYASGPVGVSVVGLLGLVEVVVLLSGRQERTDPATVAGLGFVLSLSMLGIAVLWAVGIDQTVLFSFPREYAWLEYHPWTVVAGAALTFAGAAGYARSVL